MSNFAQILEEELSEAVDVKNEKALKRYIGLLVESVMEKEKANEQFAEIRSDIRVIAETMHEGFRQIDKRFEQMDKRFEELIHYMDKRFEAVDKRFEAVDKRFEAVDKRFEAVDKRFEDMFHYMDKRFEDLNKRIGFLSWFMPTIITVLLTIVMAVMKFL